MLFAMLVVAWLVGCGRGGAPRVDLELAVIGDVDSPLSLSYQELTGTGQTDLSGALMQRSLGEDHITSRSSIP